MKGLNHFQNQPQESVLTEEELDAYVKDSRNIGLREYLLCVLCVIKSEMILHFISHLSLGFFDRDSEGPEFMIETKKPAEKGKTGRKKADKDRFFRSLRGR
jgi:hypothetical protein